MEKNLLTIRQTAKLGLLSEHALRNFVRQGRIPGIRIGNRFMVNVQQLKDQLANLPGNINQKGGDF